MDRKKHEKLGKVGLMSLTILTALMFVFVSVVLANPEGVLDANFDFDWQGDASGEVLSAYTEQESNVLSGPWNYLYGRSVLTECKHQNTEIVFYEKAGEIKVCIRALSPEVQGIIESGSISMSISEEYDLDYFTGLAYGIRAEGPYQYLNSGMNKIEKSALFLSGFIPGIGPGFGIVQYVDDMKDPNEFDWYEQWDMTLDSSQPCMYIARDYFESNEALNTRDIAVIPWYKPIYVLSFSEVVLYPPALPVQDYQSDNIAFRVEYAVSPCRDNKGMLNLGKKIRLDVLIPIEIGYTYDWPRGFVEEIRDPEETPTPPPTIAPTPTPTTTPEPANAQSAIEWSTSDQEGMQIAKSQNKPTMILFYSDRCPASAKLAEVFADSRVINMSKNFVPIVGSRVLDSQYGIRYVPTIVFTNSQGMEVHRIVGYRDADTLMQEMQKALRLSTTLDATATPKPTPKPTPTPTIEEEAVEKAVETVKEIIEEITATPVPAP